MLIFKKFGKFLKGKNCAKAGRVTYVKKVNRCRFFSNLDDVCDRLIGVMPVFKCNLIVWFETEFENCILSYRSL